MLSRVQCVHRSAFIVSCCLLLALFLAACGGGTSASPTPAPKPSPSPSPSPTSSTTLTTYQGKGFTIGYPQSWKVTASGNAVSFTDSASLNDFEIVTTPNPGGVASPDFVVTTAINATKATMKNPQTVNVPPTTTIGGESWVQKSFAGATTSNGQNVVVQIVVAADNHPGQLPFDQRLYRRLRYGAAIIRYGQYHVLPTHASIVQVHILIARTSFLQGQYNPFENIRATSNCLNSYKLRGYNMYCISLLL